MLNHLPSLQPAGTVIAAPQGITGFAVPSSGRRNWIVMAPLVRKRGNVVEVTEQSMLSGPKGWNRAIYGASALGTPVDYSSGLTDNGGLGGSGTAFTQGAPFVNPPTGI